MGTTTLSSAKNLPQAVKSLLLVICFWDKNKEAYFATIQAGMTDARAMTELVRQVLRESLQHAID